MHTVVHTNSYIVGPSSKRFSWTSFGCSPSQPAGNQALPIDVVLKDAAKWVRTFGRSGIMARVMQLNIVDSEDQLLRACRVLARNVYVNAKTLQLESINFMYCPQQRIVDCPIPVKIWNEEMAPVTKKGGWFHVVNRTVLFRCPSTVIPPLFELDVRDMDLHEIIRMQDLKAPEGCKLAAPDGMQPVVRATLKVGTD